MQEFTSTQLRIESSKVYNEVHTSGQVSIRHRDRPDMVLIRKDVLDQIKKGKITA